MPNELDLLHEDFLKTHCLVVAEAQGPGEVGVHFRVLRPRRDLLDVVGTIWLDSATYLARRIELEYMDFDESRGTVRVDFADVPVGVRHAADACGRNVHDAAVANESHQAHPGNVDDRLLRLRGSGASSASTSCRTS